MQLAEAMRTTAAVREFTDDPLADDVLARILEVARFAPSGGNRQGARIVAVRDRATRARLAELNEPAARRYLAQAKAGEGPWNPLTPPGPSAEQIAGTRVPRSFTEPVLKAPVVLVVLVDQGTLAATDQELDRVGLVGGASIYPLVWNILLAARAEGYGGVITTMAAAQEPAVLELLGAPAQYAVAAVVPLGRPAHQPTRLKRRAVAELVTRERFDGEPLA